MISAIILSGGKAKRMGGEKSFRKYNEKFLVENIADVLVEMKIPFITVFKNLKLINGPENYKKSHSLTKTIDTEIANQLYFFRKYCQTITWDILSDKGPLVGILSGMRVSSSEWILVLPCDMPFVTKDSINKLINFIPNAKLKKCNCIVPRHENGNLEPLFSIYHKSSIKVLEELARKIKENEGNVKKEKKEKYSSIRKLIDNLKPLYVDANEIDPTKKTFINVNTLDDLKLLNG
ncbi:MAG: molybdenum cofactor guanylyltransferase [Bacteroidales bacterium]|nr:molybdenum cofactor guanylyltransferase [Bacteroidales bacterium]MDK2988296.1 molybdenum cofactor guanylyltransferase [Methanothermococcus sp.]